MRTLVAQVTVIIVNFNGGDYVSRCLLALRLQTYTDFRVVIVDNASSDGSPERIERDFPEVELVRAGGNLGFAAGNNLGFHRAAGSEWVALLNPDAFAEPAWLEKLIAAAARRPQGGSFGSKLLRADDPGTLDGIGDVYHVSGLHWREGFGKSLAPWALVEKQIFSPCAAAALYRLSAVREIGGFDEDFFCYSEDVDLGFRLRLRGYESWYVPESTVHHVGSATTGKTSDFTMYHGYRNAIWAYVKDMPGFLLWSCLPALLLGFLVMSAKLVARGQGSVVRRAVGDAVAGLPAAWRKRQRVQETRRIGTWQVWRLLDKSLPGMRR
jgi:GT2 family glycosyltransferase